MKKLIFLLSLFLALGINTYAQNITRLEYSIDGFVAEGNGTALDVPGNAPDLNSTFNIDVTGLEPGNHTIYFRAMNDQGVWSFAAERSFYIPEPPITDGIVAMEYTMDDFKKEGDGQALALNENTNALDSTLVFDVSKMEPGLHNIYMRAKNKMGVWSFPVDRSFVVSRPDTTKVEKIVYRIYNDNYESAWMTSDVMPTRKQVDSALMVSTSGLDLDQNYSMEFYARNNKGVRGFSAFLNNVDLMQNSSPVSLMDTLRLMMNFNENLSVSMDSLFDDANLMQGDSLIYQIVAANPIDLLDFTKWSTARVLSLMPAESNVGEYSFRLKAMDLSGESDSLMVALDVMNPTGIENNKTVKDQFLIYPNPVIDVLTIRINSAIGSGYHLSLFNISGQLMTAGSVSDKEYHMNLSGYSQGVYFILIQNKDLQIRKTIVHQ